MKKRTLPSGKTEPFILVASGKVRVKNVVESWGIMKDLVVVPKAGKATRETIRRVANSSVSSLVSFIFFALIS